MFNFIFISVTITSIHKTLVILATLGSVVMPTLALAEGAGRERPTWLPRSVNASSKAEDSKPQREPLKETGRRLENDPAILDKLRVILKEGIPAQMTVDVINRHGATQTPSPAAQVQKIAHKPRPHTPALASKISVQEKMTTTACDGNERATPIHIRTEDSVELTLEQPVFHYGPLTGEIVNNGQMIEVQVTGHHMLSVRGESYQLKSFHFHNPAQDSIDDQRYPMVMHAVHTNAQGKTLELIVPIDWGDPNPLMTALWGRLPTLKNDRYPLEVGSMGLATLLPEQRSYFVFTEQPSKPACSQQPITYVFMENPLKASPEQIRAFKTLYPDNMQASAGRLIFKSK